MKAERGFSLIETMIAAAMLGLITAAFVSTMSFAATESARTRLRGVAASDAFAQLERFIAIVRVTGAVSDAERCALLRSPLAPFDVSGGGVASGACPRLVATDIPVQGGGVRRTISIDDATLGDGRPAWLLRVVERAAVLRDPVVVETLVAR